VPAPYGTWYIEAMDSHGGWVASAPDLVRFASSFNNPSASKILSANSIRITFARPGYLKEGEGARPRPKAKAKANAKAKAKQAEDNDRYYACGWEVVPVGGGKRNTFHSGYLDGTSTILVRRWDGLDWAVLFNSDDTNGDEDFADAIDSLMHDAADAVQAWPEIDLFPQLLRPRAEGEPRQANPAAKGGRSG
jgi:N-acyl-D-amino-acid deacylase